MTKQLQSRLKLGKFLFGPTNFFEKLDNDNAPTEFYCDNMSNSPVDCIHYVPYDELVQLEVARRDTVINFKARLVGNGGDSARVGGAVQYSEAPKISGNTGARCNNCPSKGCEFCPMFGVGKNPAFEKREKERKLKAERRRLLQMRDEEKKTADL